MGLSNTLRVCFVTVTYVLMIKGNCYRGTKSCCVGYYWNDNRQECEVCLDGYFGLNCSKFCPYPTYGKKCLKTCDCPKLFCVPTFGCAVRQENTDDGDSITKTAKYNISSEENSAFSTERQETTPRNKKHVPSNIKKSSNLFVAILIAVAFLIIVTILQMVIKRKLSRKRPIGNNSAEVPQTENIHSRQSERRVSGNGILTETQI